MLSLNDREWKEFLMGDIFDIQRGESLYIQDSSAGNSPYISATANNNGVSAYINKVNRQSNMISVAYDGAVCSSFFQSHEWFASEKVVSLALKNGCLINQKLANFLCYTIYHQREKYSYGYKFSVNKRMKKQPIMLPINEEGQPDYDFMEAYISEQEQQKKQVYFDYCDKKLQELGPLVNIDEIEDKDWKEFFVSDIFDTPKRGKRIISDNYVDGDMAIVSSAGWNNGVIAFAGNEEKVKIYGDCLSVANGGVSAGFAFYHPYEFIATDHVTHFKGDSLNKYHYLFLATIIKNQMHEKYDFSREMTDPRLQREKVIVPVNSDGKPDYDYMEQYAKNMMIKKYRQYLDYVHVTI